MSRRPTEVLDSYFDAFNRGDLAACMALWSDGIEILVGVEGANPGLHSGPDAVAGWFVQWFGSFKPGYTMELQEVQEAGDRVVASLLHRGVGLQSGVPVETTLGYVFEVRDSRIARIELYRGFSEALEAVGLSESGS